MRTIGQLFRRFLWMFKVKDCRHVCLFCEYYHVCTIDGATERRGKEMNTLFQQRGGRGQVRTIGQLFRRFLWMFKVKDCRHVCLFCEYYHVCTIDGATERRGKEMNMKYAMRNEDTEQIAVIQWSQYNMNHYPELKWLHHCPNGGSRNQCEAVKLKQMGVKAGVSDLCLPYPKGIYCGLYIEMKYGNNRQQDSQKEFLKEMAEAGHFVATCYSAEEAISVITEYLNLKASTFGNSYAEFLEQFGCKPEEVGQKMKIPNNSILKDGKVKGGAKR